MKIKKPSLKGMKHTEYLGHFAQDKYMEKGHNLSIGNALKKVGSVATAPIRAAASTANAAARAAVKPVGQALRETVQRPIGGMIGAAKSLVKGDVAGAVKQSVDSGPVGTVRRALRETGKPMAPSVEKKSLSGPKRARIMRPMGK